MTVVFTTVAVIARMFFVFLTYYFPFVDFVLWHGFVHVLKCIWEEEKWITRNCVKNKEVLGLFLFLSHYLYWSDKEKKKKTSRFCCNLMVIQKHACWSRVVGGANGRAWWPLAYIYLARMTEMWVHVMVCVQLVVAFPPPPPPPPAARIVKLYVIVIFVELNNLTQFIIPVEGSLNWTWSCGPNLLFPSPL